MPSTHRPLLALALLASFASPVLAAPADLAGADPAVRPQDDLFAHVNGGWLATAKIPGDKKSFGSFMILREKSNTDVRELLEDARRDRPGRTPESQLIGDYYAAMLDLPTIERTGLPALQAEFARIAAVKNLDDVAAAMGALNLAGAAMPAEAGVMADEKHPDVNAVYWGQGGLGMPDRDYFLKPGADAEAVRTAYRGYLAELGRLAGLTAPESAAADVLAFETELARIQWTKVERRDAVKTYNPTPRAAWTTAYAEFPWSRFGQALGMPGAAGAIVAEPTYFKAFGRLATKTPLATWQAYMRLRLLDTYAPYMGARFRAAAHHFKGETLSGLTAMSPDWRTAVDATNAALGEAIGARYVAKHFPPAAKARMKTLVANLLVVYRRNLATLSWMTPATRKAAVDKLAHFRVKIGYPDHWRGYPGLVVRRDDAVGNMLRANHFESARDMAEAGKPVDRTRWDMTPQTVNAYYNPVGNEIVFPAAILQTPFFDARRDDAYNYGAIGAVIGHEISHGFDDQGRRYDGTGRLRDWWTPSDEKAFNERAEKLIAQYGNYAPLPDLHINGQLTLGENIADLTGVKMALEAYHLGLGGQPARKLDGFSADQRFFLGYARVWRSKNRPEWLRVRLLSDPHSPEQYRTNGVVTNVDAFYDAFGLQPGDKLYKKPADRVHIW